MCTPTYEWNLSGGSFGRCTGMAGSGYLTPPAPLHPRCRCTIQISDCADTIEATDVKVMPQGETVYILFTATICCWDGSHKEIATVYEFDVGHYIENESEIPHDMYADLIDAGLDQAGFCPPCGSGPAIV